MHCCACVIVLQVQKDLNVPLLTDTPLNMEPDDMPMTQHRQQPPGRHFDQSFLAAFCCRSSQRHLILQSSAQSAHKHAHTALGHIPHIGVSSDTM